MGDSFMIGGVVSVLAMSVGLLGALGRDGRPTRADAAGLTSEAEAARLAKSPAEAPDSSSVLGLLVAPRAIDLTSRQAGTISAVSVRVGDRVKRDTIVATLDQRLSKHDHGAAKAQARAARVDLDRAGIELAQAKAKRAHLVRLAELASGEEREAAVYQEQLAVARVEAARAHAAEQTSRLGMSAQGVTDNELRAPFDAIVAVCYLTAGASVTPNRPILRLIADEGLTVRFGVADKDLAHVAVGANVDIEPVDHPTVRLVGRVETRAPEVDSASGLVVIEARVDEEEAKRHALVSGTQTRVYFRRGEH